MLDPFAVPIGRRSPRPHSDASRTFGSQGSLSLTIRRDAEGARLKIVIDDDVIWDHVQGEEAAAIDGVRFDHHAFLEFFSDNWSALWLEGFPANVSMDDAVWTGKRLFDWDAFAKMVPTTEAWVAFQSRHCVSNIIVEAIERSTQPEWWLIGSNSKLHIAVPDLDLYRAVPLGQAMGAIERCCNHIAEWISSEATERSVQLLQDWCGRRQRTNRLENVRLYTGLSDNKLVREIANDVDGDSVSDVLHHRSPILAVARMRPTRVETADLRILFSMMTDCRKQETPVLDELTKQALEAFMTPSFERLKPHVQAQRVAAWLRKTLGYAEDEIIDPTRFLESYGVQLARVNLQTSTIDAVAFWGERNGPGVLINRRGRFARTTNGARATLAHEICHLLLDRKTHLPLADVIGGAVAEPLEKRARAFAAELLLPQRVAYQAFEAMDQDGDSIETIIRSLAREYSVSLWIAGHQLRNIIKDTSQISSRDLRPIIAYLERITSRPVTHGSK